MIDNFGLNFLYRIITILDSARRRPLAYVCLNRVMAVYGDTQGTLPDETGANPRYLRNRMVQRFAIMVKLLIMSLSIEVWVRLFQIGIFATGNCPHVCWNGERESG